MYPIMLNLPGIVFKIRIQAWIGGQIKLALVLDVRQMAWAGM